MSRGSGLITEKEKEKVKLRRETNKERNRRSFRDQLNFTRCLNQIDNAVREVIESRYSMDKEKLDNYKFVCDVNFRKINKLLPDLKAIEIEEEGDIKHVKIDMKLTPEEAAQLYKQKLGGR